MTKLLLGCAVFAMAAGCVTARPERKTAVKVVAMNEVDPATASPDNTYVCEEGAKTGTNIKGSVCQSLRQRELERQAAQDTMHRMMQSGFKR